MNAVDSSLDWYVVHLRSRQYAAIEINLRNLGYKVFAPTYRANAVGRMRNSLRPLFPGYLFCALDPQHQLPVLMVSGVIGILGAGKRLIPVAPEEIGGIQRAVASNLYCEPVGSFVPGERVIVAAGPLKGVEGIVAQHKGVRSLILSVTLLNRSVAVELDATAVERVGSLSARRTVDSGRAA